MIVICPDLNEPAHNTIRVTVKALVLDATNPKKH